MPLSAEAKSVIQDCASRSYAGTITFPDVVARLTAAGVDHYEVDLLRGETVYFLPDGSWHAENLKAPGTAAPDFDAAGVEAAVRAAQRGEIKYPEFLKRILAAGCVRYFAYLAGRNVAYLGRRGEAHIERFPGAN
jgi:uncharacterized protein YbcV (DUF1398 family)